VAGIKLAVIRTHYRVYTRRLYPPIRRWPAEFALENRMPGALFQAQRTPPVQMINAP
jgi:hypothetical protein